MDQGEDGPTMASENLAKRSIQSPLAQALTVHEKNHAGLADILSALEDKLGPLLRPQENAEKAAGSATDTTSPPQSDLVRGIEDSNHRLRRYTNRLRVLLERLEV